MALKIVLIGFGDVIWVQAPVRAHEHGELIEARYKSARSGERFALGEAPQSVKRS